jgi:hypothetical protein
MTLGMAEVNEQRTGLQGSGTRFTLLHPTKQTGNPAEPGTTSRWIGNASHDMGTPAQVCSKQVMTLIKLYERTIDRVYHYFYNLVSNVSEAEVLTSETITRAIEALTCGHYVWRGATFEEWLMGIGPTFFKSRTGD